MYASTLSAYRRDNTRSAASLKAYKIAYAMAELNSTLQTVQRSIMIISLLALTVLPLAANSTMV